MDWYGTIVYSGSDFDRYNIFFYYSILTLVTNELMPKSQLEIAVSIVILLIGYMTIGVLIGEFSSILNDMNERA